MTVFSMERFFLKISEMKMPKHHKIAKTAIPLPASMPLRIPPAIKREIAKDAKPLTLPIFPKKKKMGRGIRIKTMTPAKGTSETVKKDRDMTKIPQNKCLFRNPLIYVLTWGTRYA